MKRGKKSYITFTLQFDVVDVGLIITAQNIRHEVLNNLSLLFGQFNHLRLSREFTVLYYNSTSNYGIIQVNNDFYQEVLCGLVLVRNLGKHNVNVVVVHVGRTLKGCKRVVVDNYLCSLERCIIQEKVYGSSENSVKAAIDTLKSVSLLPH